MRLHALRVFGLFSLVLNRNSKNSLSLNEMAKITPLSRSKCTVGACLSHHHRVADDLPTPSAARWVHSRAADVEREAAMWPTAR